MSLGATWYDTGTASVRGRRVAIDGGGGSDKGRGGDRNAEFGPSYGSGASGDAGGVVSGAGGVV
ncbi:MAG: hypothetical protein JJ992_28275, partial [Planctomycetes bacterium]|nr:hypothetical protein [Planctomycetota bacterium]